MTKVAKLLTIYQHCIINKVFYKELSHIVSQRPPENPARARMYMDIGVCL